VPSSDYFLEERGHTLEVLPASDTLTLPDYVLGPMSLAAAQKLQEFYVNHWDICGDVFYDLSEGLY
jgi:hypothetical protein